MIPGTILYVDDEAMALKYFERLVSPLAPVITAPSVAEGKAVLQKRGSEIAVLVSDQRMPGAHGNELLRYAREHHPGIVRMLTTAYSELGEAIEAINSGEIYRYVTKPWDLESLHADLRNALELAVLRAERDGLLKEKMLLQQQQLLGHRAGQLALACAGFVQQDAAHALHVFLETAVAAGCTPPVIDWSVMDYADLIEHEAARGTAIGRQLAEWQRGFASAGSPGEALAALAQALPGQARVQGDTLKVSDARAFTDLLSASPQQLPSPAQLAWLAWLVRWSPGVKVQADGGGWDVALRAAAAAPALPQDWLAGDIEQLQLAVAAAGPAGASPGA
jgi:two-component system probable response regulator PhcQ